MTILHYTLGLSPQRSGGLTKYATDLMNEQQKSNKIVLLYPSGYSYFGGEVNCISRGIIGGVQSIMLRNTMPVALLYGVKSPSDFISKNKMSVQAMERLYSDVAPDIFHVHTLMGLPLELLQFFKSKGVKLLFTAHDYYGICPKVNFINHKGELCSAPSEENCKACNVKAASTIFLRLRNSKFVLNIKNNRVLRKFIR